MKTLEKCPIFSVVHFEIYDSVFSCLKNEHTNQDLHAYKAAKEFCKRNGTPKQLGPTFYNFIPNAAVIKLQTLISIVYRKKISGGGAVHDQQ